MATTNADDATIQPVSFSVEVPTPIFRTRAGLPKTRHTKDEELTILGMGQSTLATEARLNEFMRLFAFRYTHAIVTRTGQGPRAWTSLPRILKPFHVIRHLLADRIKTRPPKWFGTRSFATSAYFVIDVDAIRTREQDLDDKYDLTNADDDTKSWLLQRTKEPMPKPPFAERCEQVERALRRLGIEPNNPMQVMIQPSPSGGRHYYVFLDAPYSLDQIYAVLEAAGLKHVPGEIEFFPSTSRSFRLPFGFIPGQPYDPNAWIQFIDDYRNGHVRRFALAQLNDNLSRHLASHRTRRARQIESIKTPHTRLIAYLGQPKRSLGRGANHAAQRLNPDRYQELISSQIQSLAEAEELTALGIQVTGTRTEALKRLAAHLIWFRHCSPAEATKILTTWAMDPRHRSKDIAHDLQYGTQIVPTHIATMCRWYESRKRTAPLAKSYLVDATFAPQELDAITKALAQVNEPEREMLGHFFLHFLAFAKAHGTRKANDDGFAAAPAINAIIKRWLGCGRTNYKIRIDQAVATGIFSVIKGHWRNPKGPGRARTYGLQVPVVPEVEQTLGYDDALDRLLDKTRIDAPVEAVTTNAISEAKRTEENPDANHRHHFAATTDASVRDHAPPVRPTYAASGMESHSHQRHQESNEATAILGPDSRHIEAGPSMRGRPPRRRARTPVGHDYSHHDLIFSEIRRSRSRDGNQCTSSFGNSRTASCVQVNLSP